MDIIESRYRRDLFFMTINSIKEGGFDSYSKDRNDIVRHYENKYQEIDPSLKSTIRYSNNRWDTIINTVNKYLLDDYLKEIDPFEEFILAFLLAFNDQYFLAIRTFKDCISKLPDNISGKINKVFINLQIGQLLERQEEYKQALKILIDTKKFIRSDRGLYMIVHSFYASCCVSIGLLCYRYSPYPKIAYSCFTCSAIIRASYQNTYSNSVFKNYLSYVYRYIGMLEFLDPQTAYIYLKSAYQLRLEILHQSADVVTLEELFHLLRDFIIFLIKHRYRIDIVNRYTRLLNKLINSMNHAVRINLCFYILNISSALIKYYILLNDTDKSNNWQKIKNYFSKYAPENETDSSIYFKSSTKN